MSITHTQRIAGSPAAGQSGVALITVMFILFLISTLIVYTVDDEQIAIRRVGNIRDTEQGYQLVSGAEQWATKVLARDAKDNEWDHLNEAWNSLESAQVEEGTMAAQVYDQQGLFNLNNLAKGKESPWYPAFVRLLQVLELEQGIADAVVDWIDANEQRLGQFGAEDLEYLLKDPPYRAANRYFTDPGELRWIEGVDADALALLAPLVTALPTDSAQINVNTCPEILLQILGSEAIDAQDAAALVEGRGDAGYENTGDFLAQPAMSGRGDVASPLITVSSQYFSVVGQAEYGRFVYKMISLLKRTFEDAKVIVIRRQRGLT